MIGVLPLVVGLAWADDPPSGDGDQPPKDPPPADTPADPPPATPPGPPPPSSDFPSEDEMFGAPATPPPADTPAPTGPFEDIQRLSNKDIADTMAGTEDRFTVGGQIWLQFQGSHGEKNDLEDLTLTSPSFADLYGDARPNDRVRGYLRVRFRNDFTVSPSDTDAFGNASSQQSISLDQFWLKFDAWKRVYLTIGKQRIRWGTGRFWNPTDFMQSQQLDGLAVYDLRLGVPMVKVHVPIEKTGTNLYALANIDAASTPGEIGVALRAEQVIGSCEVSASTLIRKDEPFKVGLDFSGPLGPFDVKLEGALTRGTESTKPRWEGELDLDTLTVPTEADWDDRWIPQLVAGTEVAVRYNDEDTINFGGEYFYNGRGYEDADLYLWLLFNGDFDAFYLGQHYAGAYVFLANPGRVRDQSFTASVLGNLSDRSFVARGDWRVTVNTYLNLNTYVQGHFGEDGEFHYPISVPAVPGLVEEAIEVAAPLVDVGFGAQITF